MSIAVTTDLDSAPTRLLLVPLTSAIACVALAANPEPSGMVSGAIFR